MLVQMSDHSLRSNIHSLVCLDICCEGMRVSLPNPGGPAQRISRSRCYGVRCESSVGPPPPIAHNIAPILGDGTRGVSARLYPILAPQMAQVHRVGLPTETKLRSAKHPVQVPHDPSDQAVFFKRSMSFASPYPYALPRTTPEVRPYAKIGFTDCSILDSDFAIATSSGTVVLTFHPQPPHGAPPPPHGAPPDATTTLPSPETASRRTNHQTCSHKPKVRL